MSNTDFNFGSLQPPISDFGYGAFPTTPDLFAFPKDQSSIAPTYASGYGPFNPNPTPGPYGVAAAPIAPQSPIPSATANMGGGTMGSAPATSNSGGSFSACFTAWAIRATVIILGFVFVAVGLSHFGIQTIPIPARLKK